MGWESREWVGLDSETYNGEPYTLQFWHPKCKWRRFLGVSPKTVTEKFLGALLRYPSGTALWVHNLEFDLPVLFFPWMEAFSTENSFELWHGDFKVRILYGKVNAADISVKGQHYLLRDSFAFFKEGVAALSERFNLPPKMKKPVNLGTRRYHGQDLVSFKAYGMRDAEIHWGIGKQIETFQQIYNVRESISAPQLSARIFRHRFIPENESIPPNPMDVDEAALLSYHGGKNGLYGPPGVYDGVSLYDINSAYPFAFTQIPNFLSCRYIRKRRYCPGEGIWQVSGVSLPLPYNLVRNHRFEPVLGSFEDIWMTSYEVRCALHHGFIKDFRVRRGYLVQECKAFRPNPLANFANHFYEHKQKEKGPQREFFKIIMNSLYGKFIQTISENAEVVLYEIKNGRMVEEQTHTAGGLWNPLLATLITGYVRAHLTDLEVSYGALHSSTDGFVTRRRCPVGKKLGALSHKGHGSGIFLRPKLYVVWNGTPPCEVVSFALHGFHGSLATFIRLLRSGHRRYFHQRIWKPREAKIQGQQPLTMGNFFKIINLTVSEPIPIPPLRIKVGGKERVI